MKKIFKMLAALVLLAAFAAGAQAYEIEWKNNFGGAGSDHFTSVTAVLGGFVAVGDSFETSFSSGDWADFTGRGSFDAIIVRHGSDGNIAWKNNFGGSGYDRFTSVTAVSGGIVAVGYSFETSFGNGDWEGVAGNGNFDAIIVKYGNDGNVVWKNNFGGGGHDQFNSVTAVSGGVVAVGWSFESSFGNGNWAGVTGNGGSDAIIVKYNSDGNIVWKNNFGGRGDDRFLSVAAVPGGVVAVGYSFAPSFGSGDWAGVTGRGGANAIIVKYGYDGNIVWKNNFGGAGNDFFTAVAAASSGIIVAGWTREDSFGNGDWESFMGRGRSDGIVVKYDNDGNVVWKNNFGGAGPDAFTSVAELSGGFVAVGYSHGPSFGNGDWVGVTGHGGGDAIAVKYDNDGNIVWKSNFGGGGNDHFTSVTAVSGGFVAVGTSSAASIGSGDWVGVTGLGGDYAIIVRYGH